MGRKGTLDTFRREGAAGPILLKYARDTPLGPVDGGPQASSSASAKCFQGLASFTHQFVLNVPFSQKFPGESEGTSLIPIVRWGHHLIKDYYLLHICDLGVWYWVTARIRVIKVNFGQESHRY